MNSSNPTIPAEAVAAAAEAFIEHGTLLPALEAAAPQIRALVLEEAAERLAEIETLNTSSAISEWLRGGAT